MNLSPALSPDGRRLVYLSEKSLFSIDMYVADAATGRITRKIVSTATDPHFDSLQFLNSAGDWAPDNRRFAFAALSSGRPVLAIVDTNTGRRETERKFDDLDEIYNPAWSPDGRTIAFSAMRGGVLDLFVFTVADRRVAAADRRRLCRSRSGVVARRPRVGVGDRSLLVRPRFAGVRQLPASAAWSWRAGRCGSWPDSPPAATPIPNMPLTAPCSSSPRRMALPTSIGCRLARQCRRLASPTFCPVSAASLR